MRILFEMDKRDHADCTRTFRRDSARAVIIKGGRAAMVYSRKHGYYKFPGGGVKAGEDPVEAMIRETREETGLIVKPETVREYGMVHRVQRSSFDETERFIQDNYYYLCETEDEVSAQNLDEYEAEEGFTLEYVELDEAIRKNRSAASGDPIDAVMFEREARVLETLMCEGMFNN